jgi:hypothetical protein
MLDFGPTSQLVSLIDDLVHFLRIAFNKGGHRSEKIFMITILKLKMYKTSLVVRASDY